MGNNMPKIKSNSCENLAEEDEPSAPKTEKKTTMETTNTKIRIAISSSNSQPVKRTSSIKRKNSIKRTNSITKTKQEPPISAISDDECIDNYTYHHEIKSNDSNITTTTRISKLVNRTEDVLHSNSCDL